MNINLSIKQRLRARGMLIPHLHKALFVSGNYMVTLRTAYIFLICLLTGCIGAGTLGSFHSRTFPTSKQNLVQAIDKLFTNHPEYKIPDNWKYKDDWKQRGYDFLDSRIFYFQSKPEEMYFVSFLGDANDTIQADNGYTSIAVRALNTGSDKWILEESLSSSEKERIENRFDTEIISKLEQYTGTKVISQ